MIGAIAAQLIGLFVDDEFLAAAILVTVALASAAAPPWAAGLLLTLALPAALAASVWRSVRRARRDIPNR